VQAHKPTPDQYQKRGFKRAIANVIQEDDKFVSFMTACDEGCIPAGQGVVPGVVIHPEPDPVNLWCIAEARLATLDKMMAMFACAGKGLREGVFAQSLLTVRLEAIFLYAPILHEQHEHA
jgi:hypothetical protein